MKKPALIAFVGLALWVSLACLCSTSQVPAVVTRASDTPTTRAMPTQDGRPKATPTMPPQPTAATDHGDGQIVFVSCKSQNSLGMGTQCGISIMDANGSRLRQLTNVDGDGAPSLSPNGTRVVFTSGERDRDYEIYTIHTDGSGLKRLTAHPGVDTQPSWSPDGSQIIYTSCSDDSHCYISIMDADGSNPHTLSNTNASFPRWSPDGGQIVFAAGKILNTMNADGTNVRVITNQAQLIYSPVWSPDGSQIAFLTRKTSDGPVEVDVIDKDGRNQRSLTAGYYVVYGGLSWSPDGQKLLFTMNGDGSSTHGASQLYIVNADGSGLQKLDAPCTYCFAGDWGR
jgi:TolB protein